MKMSDSSVLPELSEKDFQALFYSSLWYITFGAIRKFYVPPNLPLCFHPSLHAPLLIAALLFRHFTRVVNLNSATLSPEKPERSIFIVVILGIKVSGCHRLC